MRDSRKITTCINCGALLINRKCEYCGTDYTDNAKVSGVIGKDFFGEIVVANQKFKVYLSEVEVESDTADVMTCDGSFWNRVVTNRRRKFTFIEC